MSSEERRVDPTIGALRQNWPILLAVFFGITGYTSLESQVDDNTRELIEHNELLDRDAFKEFAIWQTNVTRDILALQKEAKSCS